MPISVDCPGCGKHYRLRDALAGRRVKCRCGRVVAVPEPESEPAEPVESDWVDDAFRAPTPAAAPPQGGVVERAPSAAPPQTAEPRSQSPRRRRESETEARQREIVGKACLIYGGIMTVVFALVPSFAPSFLGIGFLAFAQPLFAILVAVGGRLILRGDERGPSVAGLSCLIIGFLHAVGTFRAFGLALTVGHLGKAALLLLYLAVVYPVPVYATIWCLKQEEARRADSDDED